MYANKLDQCSPGQSKTSQPRSPDVVYGSQDCMGDQPGD